MSTTRRLAAILAATSAHGTNRTNLAGLAKSVVRDGPEVTGRGSNRRD
jgi:hypothetical protein